MGARLKPGEMRRGKRDRETGIAWVQVSREAAHGHPLGQLDWVMYLIIGFFLFAGLTRGWMVAGQGAGMALVLGVVALPLVTALLLWMRAALARVLVVGTGLFALFGILSRGFDGTADAGLAASLWVLGELIAILAITVYLWEGDRPNMIYAHRFRSYRDAEGKA
ncbi:hypothetical protein [Aquicoccus porphyridii]|uniref:Uncharacterized protein n=1 Tax=Aquicoccus porphyridii TaxID=1852029 RepID=A0A5A9ZCN1_9RHOB|nr:hypothetical protein [Aquicoccus porphyridii]KAA0914735.1 hypothetical protein FLO80_12095 [Aquicoccus porphyridii]RAI53351.1 hypothetical protein DOO74_13645 [Rhodobacteraceae bacterium AsT-22]